MASLRLYESGSYDWVCCTVLHRLLKKRMLKWNGQFSLVFGLEPCHLVLVWAHAFFVHDGALKSRSFGWLGNLKADVLSMENRQEFTFQSSCRGSRTPKGRAYPRLALQQPFCCRVVTEAQCVPQQPDGAPRWDLASGALSPSSWTRVSALIPRTLFSSLE